MARRPVTCFVPIRVDERYASIGDDNVTTIKAQTIVVLFLLLALLSRLPRLDDPPEMRVVNGEIARVEEMQGAALYMDAGMDEAELVYVSRLYMHEDVSGIAYVTGLEGTVCGPDGRLVRKSIDDTERASSLGWTPVSSLDGLVSPGNGRERNAFALNRLRLRRVIHKGRDVLFAVTRVEGTDLETGRVISEDTGGDLICPAIPLLEHVAVPTSSGGSERFWALTGTVCWNDGRRPTWPGSPGWTAGNRCR